jgi:pimeloyl-ACP methyl ester carboxylesterase
MICGDRLRLQWLRKDPLALIWMPARAHWNARRLIVRARGALAKVRQPILCVQGALDPVTRPGLNRLLFEGRAEARFVLWEEAYHDLALEANGEYFAGLLADWMRNHGVEG